MNKLSFFALPMLFTAQISSSEPAKTTQYKVYRYLSMHSEFAPKCSTVEPAFSWWLQGELECACDSIEESFRTAATICFLDPAVMFSSNQEDEKKAIRTIFSDESVESKWKAYDRLQGLKKELHEERRKEYVAQAAQERLVQF